MAADGAERQIEEMKQKAANAVATFVVESGKLEEAKQVLKEALDRSAETLDRLERLKKDADDLEADIRMRCETLPVEIEQIQAELAELQEEKAAVMAVDVPLVDQVELRILPKLRDLTIDDHKQAFDNLVTLIDQDLRDSALARSLGNLLERQRDGNGQFNWRGFNR